MKVGCHDTSDHPLVLSAFTQPITTFCFPLLHSILNHHFVPEFPAFLALLRSARFPADPVVFLALIQMLHFLLDSIWRLGQTVDFIILEVENST